MTTARQVALLLILAGVLAATMILETRWAHDDCRHGIDTAASCQGVAR